MIESAQIQKIIKQVGQFDVAMSIYQGKYKRLPADNGSGCGGVCGRNGRIDSYWEMTSFWSDLSITGLKNAKGNSYPLFLPFQSPWMPMSADNCPVFDIDQNKLMPACLNVFWKWSSTFYSYSMFNNELSPPTTFHNHRYDPLKTKHVAAIDNKIDDALPITGNVFAQTLGTSTIGNCRSGSSYNLSSDEYLCSMQIMFRSTNGGFN